MADEYTYAMMRAGEQTQKSIAAARQTNLVRLQIKEVGRILATAQAAAGPRHKAQATLESIRAARKIFAAQKSDAIKALKLALKVWLINNEEFGTQVDGFGSSWPYPRFPGHVYGNTVDHLA